MKDTFRITYDGAALISHEMDARELAPALLAISDLLEAANRALNQQRADMSVCVKGSFKTGCFGIDFSVTQKLTSQLIELFAGSASTAIVNAAGIGSLIWMGKTGLVNTLRWLRGRTITKVAEQGDYATIYSDTDSLTVEIRVLALLKDYEVRKALQAATKPLDREGIDTLAFGTDTEIIETITKAEMPWFIVPALEDEQLSETEYDTTLQISRIEWNEENKWRFTEGDASFYAIILDDTFLNKINKNEAVFSKGDILKVRIKKTQWLSGDKIHVQYFIMQVINHHSGSRQIRLPLS